MCTNQRRIINKYTRQELYVKCGHCPACLQEKAAYRVGRIRNQESRDDEMIMIGLTYRRHCAPYVLRDDAYKFSKGEILTLPVYRDTHFRKVRKTASYDIGYNVYKETRKLCEVDYISDVDFSNVRDLVGDKGKIGVTYYPDVQRFIARLRLNLKRNYNYDYPFKTYICSEYGAGKKKGHGIYRPHFHILLSAPKGNFKTLRDAIVSSWPYGDLSNRPRAIEVAYNAKSYVSSYVNCGNDFPFFLKKYFAPKHSYSKGYGCCNDLFSLRSILAKFERGHLTYTRMLADKVGCPVVEFPIPKYIIHRYFPLFKGYFRVAPSSLCDIMQRFAGYNEYEDSRSNMKFLYEDLTCTDFHFLNKMAFPVYYNYDDIHKIKIRLLNALTRFRESSGLIDYSFDDYFRLHKKIWSLYKSDVLRLSMQNEDIPLEEKYDNLDYIKSGYESGGSLPVGFTPAMLSITDPNKFFHVVRSTDRFTMSYYEHLKKRTVTGTVLSSLYEDF